MTRIILLGRDSFIARAMARVAEARGVPYTALPRNAPLYGLTPDDCLVNFTLTSAYRTKAYDESEDYDLRAAKAAAHAGAAFVMLSSRRVYGPDTRWNARECQNAEGDETAYGRNKARTERSVRKSLDGRVGIFRLPNIFGYEYDWKTPRRSFAGTLLRTLKEQNKIFFDMSSATRRDFLPVEVCAAALLDRAVSRAVGTYNLGSGIPLTCGHLAGWILEGFGSGEQESDPDIVRDEFYLCMDKWRAEFPLPVNEEVLRDYCITLGRRLKCEKF